MTNLASVPPAGRSGLSESVQHFLWAGKSPAKAADPGPALHVALLSKMKLEMPRVYTDHPLSRKVEPKSLTLMWSTLFLLKLLWQVRDLSEEEILYDSEVLLKCVSCFL